MLTKLCPGVRHGSDKEVRRAVVGGRCDHRCVSARGWPSAETTPAWLARLEDWRWKRLRAEYADAWPDVLGVLVSGGYLWARPGRVFRQPASRPRMETITAAVTVTVTGAVTAADRREAGLVGDLIKSGYAQLGAPVPVDLDGRCITVHVVAATGALTEHEQQRGMDWRGQEP